MTNASFGDFDVFREESSDKTSLRRWRPDGRVATTCLQKVSARLARDVPRRGSPRPQDREGGCLLVLAPLLVRCLLRCWRDRWGIVLAPDQGPDLFVISTPRSEDFPIAHLSEVEEGGNEV